MDQTKFEEAIKEFVVKKVDNTNPHIIEYAIKRQPRKTVYSIATQKSRCASTYIKVATPNGVFDSPQDAAEFYGISVSGLYGRITRSKKFGNKEYYTYEEGTED